MRKGHAGTPAARMVACVAAACAVGAAAPDQVFGAEVRLSEADPGETFLDYVADPGEANQVYVNGIAGGRAWLGQSSPTTIIAEAPCTNVAPDGMASPQVASCPADTLTFFSVDLGDGAHSASPSAFVFTIPLVFSGGDGPDRLFGDAASDALYGDAGLDELYGDLSDDWLDGGTGSDSLTGSAGFDAVAYDERDGPVAVSLDGIANDGEAGESDAVAADVEAVVGSPGDDTLTGNGQVNGLAGGAGADTLDGRAGADVIFGEDGNDSVQAQDGAVDEIDCGTGVDTAVADASDVVTACESVQRPSPPASPAPPAPPLHRRLRSWDAISPARN